MVKWQSGKGNPWGVRMYVSVWWSNCMGSVAHFPPSFGICSSAREGEGGNEPRNPARRCHFYAETWEKNIPFTDRLVLSQNAHLTNETERESAKELKKSR